VKKSKKLTREFTAGLVNINQFWPRAATVELGRNRLKPDHAIICGTACDATISMIYSGQKTKTIVTLLWQQLRN
jgi:hypothetical protein